MSIDFSTLEKALNQLESALKTPPKNDLERDGVIHRFEYTFEAAWKAAKRVLGAAGITSLSPKSVIRDLAQQGWISDGELWLRFLDVRNESTHTYRKQTADGVFHLATRFPKECRELLEALRKS